MIPLPNPRQAMVPQYDEVPIISTAPPFLPYQAPIAPHPQGVGSDSPSLAQS